MFICGKDCIPLNKANQIHVYDYSSKDFLSFRLKWFKISCKNQILTSSEFLSLSWFLKIRIIEENHCMIFSALIRSILSVYFLQANPILEGTVFENFSDLPFEKGGMPDSQLYF